LAGLSAGGSFTLIPLYIAEISQDKIRGSLGSFFVLSTNLGMLLIYIAGKVFDYHTTPKIMLLLPLAFFVLFSFFPETPIYLLRNNKKHQAEKSLKFLRGIRQQDVASDDVINELNKMITKVENDAIKKRGSNLNELSEF
jgi:MFS family permease